MLECLSCEFEDQTVREIPGVGSFCLMCVPKREWDKPAICNLFASGRPDPIKMAGLVEWMIGNPDQIVQVLGWVSHESANAARREVVRSIQDTIRPVRG